MNPNATQRGSINKTRGRMFSRNITAKVNASELFICINNIDQNSTTAPIIKKTEAQKVKIFSLFGTKIHKTKKEHLVLKTAAMRAAETAVTTAAGDAAVDAAKKKLDDVMRNAGVVGEKAEGFKIKRLGRKHLFGPNRVGIKLGDERNLLAQRKYLVLGNYKDFKDFLADKTTDGATAIKDKLTTLGDDIHENGGTAQKGLAALLDEPENKKVRRWQMKGQAKAWIAAAATTAVAVGTFGAGAAVGGGVLGTLGLAAGGAGSGIAHAGATAAGAMGVFFASTLPHALTSTAGIAVMSGIGGATVIAGIQAALQALRSRRSST